MRIMLLELVAMYYHESTIAKLLNWRMQIYD